MWGQWRLTLRKAEHALKVGRLDLAAGYVARAEVRSYRQARELASRVALALAGRAEEHLKAGDSQRAWIDVAQAEKLDGAHDRLGQLRQELVRHTLDEATRLLKAGQQAAAIACLDRLTKRGVNTAEARQVRDAAAAWQSAAQQARLGKFADAIELFEKARGLMPDCEPLEESLQQAWSARDRLATLEAELHRALAGHDWSAELAVADQILAIAPEHVQARAARRRAWQAVGAPVSAIGGGRRAMIGNQQNGPGQALTVVRPGGSPAILGDEANAPNAEAAEKPGQRFLLWIDGVGGYLVCLGDRISIGQPAGWHVDIPVMADLSRLHAWIERDGEGYLLRAVRPATVNGHSVREKSVLADRSEIVLAKGVRLKFRRPNPLSTTALVEIASSHRLSLPTDAVLLMAETLIVGANSGSHVVAPGWTREVVFYRQGEELWCRTAGGFEVDGQACHDRARVTLSSRIRGEGFSLALEPLES